MTRTFTWEQHRDDHHDDPTPELDTTGCEYCEENKVGLHRYSDGSPDWESGSYRDCDGTINPFYEKQIEYIRTRPQRLPFEPSTRQYTPEWTDARRAFFDLTNDG